MKFARAIFCGLVTAAASGLQAQDFIDRLDEALTVSTADGVGRARLSGTLELEGYRVQQPAPGLLYTDGQGLFNPRLTLFVDAQWGAHLYAFVQSRTDRGFDPSEGDVETRLDEYALRFTAVDGRFSLQVGKFATVVGNWIPRHGAWDNPFVTAPLPYENLTAIWNIAPARFGATLPGWANVGPQGSLAKEYAEKPRRSPIVWGPSYASGASISGEMGKFRYALEMKNGSLSSHPGSWDDDESLWRHPTFSGRIGYRPNQMWNFGFSASEGTYLLPTAAPLIPAGFGLGDYRQQVLAQDVGYAWHRLQVWMEFYEARFTVPNVGNAETFSYYVETKYKFTPQFFGAVRWNQQSFGTISDRGKNVRWGRDTWRLDFAPTYRFTPHTQLKLQYSLQHERDGWRDYAHTFGAQLTVRF